MPRFTTRRLMMIVAVLAVGLGVGIEVQREIRRARLLRTAEGCARIARESLDHATELESHAGETQRPDVAAWCLKRAAEERRVAADMSAMEKVYRRAAAQLWPSVQETTWPPVPAVPGVLPGNPGGPPSRYTSRRTRPP